MNNTELNDLLGRIDSVTDAARHEFGTLSAAQVNWRPHPDAWSVGQCLDHLITSNSTYFPMLDKIARGQRSTRLWERMPLLPTLFGSMLKKSLAPDNTRKYKTFQNFMPTQSAIHPTIVEDFATHQGTFKKAMQSVTGVDLESVVVTSPASPIVIYSLGDCFRMLTSHEERHLNQARRVVERPEFPNR